MDCWTDDVRVWTTKNDMAATASVTIDNPARHGLRAKLDGKTVDLAICFECLHIKVYANDTEREQPILVSGSPEPVFDKILKDAKVKLADKPAK